MKKIIAAALSVLVGAFGYTIVDSAIEDRVATLESEVVELREIISDYHDNVTEPIFTTDLAVTAPVTSELPNDMTFAGLSRLGYNVIGLKPYVYINDKNPEIIGKELADYNYNECDIRTENINFVYDGKQYLIQLNKGQYITGDIGTVGGEAGVYTKPVGSAYTQYYGASENDWLKMEMTVYWDEFNNGEYLPQFSRNYSDFWWCTGYVDGQLKTYGDHESIRILCRITFETVEQAESFENALFDKGFTKTEKFSPYKVNSYKHNGDTVIFVW